MGQLANFGELEGIDGRHGWLVLELDVLRWMEYGDWSIKVSVIT